MAITSELAVIICHGSYHTPAPYMPLIKALEAQGIDAYCPQLPTADLTKLNVGDPSNPDFDREPPLGGYPQGDEDVAVVLDVLRVLVKRRKKIVMIGHSSGGWTATEAARSEFLMRSGTQEGGIIGLLYIGAFVIPVGESINSFFQPKDRPPMVPPFMRFHTHGATGLGTIVQPEKYMFNDLEASEAQKWSATLTASPILTTKLTNDAYAHLPCAYLVLDGDLTLPREYQEGMVAIQAQKTGDFTMYHSPAGHSPHLSWIQGTVETILDFVEHVEKKRLNIITQL